MATRLKTIRHPLAWLLAMALVGAVVVGAGGSDRVADAATTTTHRLTIPAAAFQPTSDAWTHQIGVGESGLKGSGAFVAPIPFYRPGAKVQVLNMRMFVLDDDNTLEHQACLRMMRTVPATGTQVQMAAVCSTNESPNVRGFQTSVSKPRNITEYQGAHLLLTIYGTTDDLVFHGARITYRVTE